MHRFPYTTDTSNDAYGVQLQLLKELPPDKRLEKALQLSQELRNMSLKAIRCRHPEFTENEIRLRFIEVTYGHELATELRALQRKVDE